MGWPTPIRYPSHRGISDSLAVIPAHPKFIEPMLLLRSADLDRLIELKLDGYRAVAITDGAMLADSSHH
jgi:hypothetical protein